MKASPFLKAAMPASTGSLFGSVCQSRHQIWLLKIAEDPSPFRAFK